jgi:hypothetical protein
MSAVNQKRIIETPRPVSAEDKPVKEKTAGIRVPWRRVGIYAAIALGLLLLGSVPTWQRARQNAAEREMAQHELRLSQLENRLAAAAIDARRGDYEPARQTASDFFTSLRNQIDLGSGSDLSEMQRENLRPLLAQRDDVITLLARNDPAAADQLSNLYATYRKTMSDVPQPSKNAREFRLEQSPIIQRV